MKAKLLLAFSIFLSGSLLYAQSLVLSHEGNALAPNEEVIIEGSYLAPELIIELDVTNTGSSPMDVLVQRYEIDMVSGSMSAICWGGLCYPPNVGLSPSATTIPAGGTISNDFSGHYYPNGNQGMSTVWYVFFNQANPNDSVMVSVVFNGLVVSVKQVTEIATRVYPNPANNFLNIEIEGSSTGNMQIELLSITGAVMSTTDVTAAKTKIGTESLQEGIYLYRVMSDGMALKTGRFIVRH